MFKSNNTVLFSILMIIITLFLVFYLSKRYKLSKKQLMIFTILVLFWSSVSIIRSYRKPYVIKNVEMGGLGLDVALAAQIASAYGLISFFLRLPLFIFSDILNKKKIFIQFGMILMAIASILVVFKPSYNTLYISSLSMGVCASMIAIFNVIFSETFAKDNTTVSVSILASAPLLGEFIAAPIQFLGTYGEYKNFWFLWISSTVIAIITLILTFFLKEIEIEKKELTIKKIGVVVKNKAFIFICFIALVQSYVKFSTSGTNMLAYGKNIEMSSLLLAYSDAIFAIFQLISSVLVGTYFIKKIRVERTLQLGILFSMLFFIIAINTNNTIIVFLAYAFNGLGYGLIYTSLISIALEYFDSSYRNISMGIFQAFFSAGIFWGDYIHKWLGNLNLGILNIDNSKNMFLVAFMVSIIGLILCNINISIKNKNN